MNRLRLITLDATNTIFKFKEPPMVNYVKFAKKHNVICQTETLIPAFYLSFKTVDKKWPHFGATSNVTSEKWWHEVIYGTFHEFERDTITPIAEDLYRYYATAEPYYVFPDVLPFVEKVKSLNIKLAIISNYDKRLPGILDELRISHFFEKIITSEEAKVSKPDPAIFEFCLKQCNIRARPENLLHIGDDLDKDYKGAKNLNWNGLVIKRRQNLDNVLVSSPRYICHSFNEVYYVMQTPGLLLPKAF